MSTRAVLAASICPSAPFLAAASARAARRTFATRLPSSTTVKRIRSDPKQRQTARQRLKEPPREARIREPSFSSQTAHTYADFQDNLSRGDLSKAMPQYSALARSQAIEASDVDNLAKLMSKPPKNISFARRASFNTWVAGCANQLIDHLKDGTVRPTHRTGFYLLSFFKEAKLFDQGSDFWSWLVRQDDDLVDPSCYGVALEMLASEGKTKLSDLEEMYNDALEKFPGSFAAYHLSPGAILPDRGQPLPVGTLNDGSLSLLKGIMSARFILGERKGGYMAFDTALRLFPTLLAPGARPLEPFFQVLNDRHSFPPSAESYKIFMLGCRSGYIRDAGPLTTVQRRLMHGMYHTNSVQEWLYRLYATFNCMHAFIDAGGSINGHTLALLAKAFRCPPLPHPNTAKYKPPQAWRVSVQAGYEAVHKLIAAGVVPIAQTVSALISLAGEGLRSDQFGEALQILDRFEMQPTKNVHLRALTAAGKLGRREAVEKFWNHLLTDAEDNEHPVSRHELEALLIACRLTDNDDFGKQEMENLAHQIDAETANKINETMEAFESPAKGDTEGNELNPVELERSIPKLMERVDELAALIMSRPRGINFFKEPLPLSSARNFYKEPLPMSLVPGDSLGPEQELRKIYDELSTDPALPVDNSKPPMMVESGYPLDELRFQNWITVNELLAHADAYQRWQATAEDPQKHPLIMPGYVQPYDNAQDLRSRIRRLRGLESEPSADGGD